MMGKYDGQMKCLSFQQPYATLIALGLKTVECRTRNIKTPIKDLVVCASKTASVYRPIDGFVYGYAIGLVNVVDCVPYKKKHGRAAMMSYMPDEKCNAWVLEDARLIKPFPVKASASFFYVDQVPEVLPTTLQAYLDYYSDAMCNNDELAIELATMLFETPDELWDIFDL